VIPNIGNWHNERHKEPKFPERDRAVTANPPPDCAGFTLVEMLVSMVITMVVFALLPPMLATVMGSTSASRGVAAGTSQARIAVESMVVQVGSASQICLPTTLTLTGPTVASGFAVRVLSLAFGKSQWDQWMVTSTHLLEEQEWPTTWTTASPVPPWVIVAQPVVNASSAPPFGLPTLVAGSPQSLSIVFYVTEKQGHESEQVLIKSTVAALNTPYLTTSTCATTED
jgi:Tfp pilus assembly protein PilV